MVWYFCILLVVVALDQLSKWAILLNLELYESIEILPGFFNLVHVTNTGAAFSLFAGASPVRHYFFVTVAVLAVIGFTLAAWEARKREPRLLWPFALVAAGAAGNLVDRLIHGHVIDFLDFHVNQLHWPAFNVADSSICIGAGLYLLMNIKVFSKER